MINAEQWKKLKREVQFYRDPQACGTQDYYRTGMVLATDGALVMCEKLRCFWLLDMIGSYLPRLRTEEFLVFYFVREPGKTEGYFVIEDGNCKILIRQFVEYTDITQDIKLFGQFTVLDNNRAELVVMLPSEY